VKAAVINTMAKANIIVINTTAKANIIVVIIKNKNAKNSGFSGFFRSLYSRA
jgi:hypothetical protein